jgi:hypothetical protein
MLKTSDYTTDYRHQGPNRNEERTNKKRQRKPQMDMENYTEDRHRKFELRKKRNVKMERNM